MQQGRNSTVLIHEATFQSSHEKQAKEKMHSTVAEAVKVAMEMNAKRAVLTHFSQRYTVSESLQKKRKPIETEETDPSVKNYLASSALMALDHLSFRLSQLANLPLLSAAFNFGVSDDN